MIRFTSDWTVNGVDYKTGQTRLFDETTEANLVDTLKVAVRDTSAPSKTRQAVDLVTPEGSSPTLLDRSTGANVGAILAAGMLGGVALGLGDSTMFQGFLGEVNDNGTTAQLLFGQACAELGAPFDKFVNGGISGENSEEILARTSALLALHNPNTVFIGPDSPNDYDDQFTAERTIAAHAATVKLCQDWPSVRKIYTMTNQPTDSMNMETVGGARGRKWIDAVNDRKRAMAAKSGGINEIVDVNSIVSLPDASNMIAGYSPEGTHFSYLGSDRINIKGVKPLLAKRTFASQWRRPYSSTDPSNILGPAASAPQGSNATGNSGTVLLTGVTGTLPNGFTGRRFVGDVTATAVASVVDNPEGYAAKSGQMVVTLGADGGAAGMTMGRAASVLQNFDNPRANSTPYKFVDKIIISAAYTGHVFTEGTSAASAPDFTGVVPGDMVQDGTVTWFVTLRPKPGDEIEVNIDLGLSALTGSGTTQGWLNLISDTGVSVDRFLNYAGIGTHSYPTTIDSARRMYRQRFKIPAAWTGVKTIQAGGFFVGKNASVATLQLHAPCVEIISRAA